MWIPKNCEKLWVRAAVVGGCVTEEDYAVCKRGQGLIPRKPQILGDGGESVDFLLVLFQTML
jgi:hypothetical protein